MCDAGAGGFKMRAKHVCHTPSTLEAGGASVCVSIAMCSDESVLAVTRAAKELKSRGRVATGLRMRMISTRIFQAIGSSSSSSSSSSSNRMIIAAPQCLIQASRVALISLRI